MTVPVDQLERRADTFATGELERFTGTLRAFTHHARELAADKVTDELERFEHTKLHALVRRAFLVGHAAGYIDKERPRWLTPTTRK